jgi:arginyl-tRNA synthetase
MVELPNGKMKSREGTVVDADDLMAAMIDDAREASSDRLDDLSDEEKENVYRIIGLGALKYFLLKVNPVNNMVFNPAESIDFNGNTGPFIQYTHARIKSVLRKAEANGDRISADNLDGVEVSEKEQTIIQKLVDFEGVVLRAGREYSPAQIANYAYDLAKEYNQFYHDTPIMKEEDVRKRQLRLVLSASVARVIKTAMSLLGIEVPERM